MKKHIQYHKDGSIWATGQMKDGAMEGYWEWFRKDGTKMRSGSFKKGLQTGVWTTYDSTGASHKTTSFDPKESLGFPLYLAKPAQRALAGAKITRLSQLTKITESDLADMHGMGPNALMAIKQNMKKQRLAFKK